MMIRSFTLCALLGMLAVTLAAQSTPIIKASATSVNIRDGQDFLENAWTITPEARPDVYTTNTKGGKVTFYTDLDSISFLVTPNQVYDFRILLNNKDTAFTRVIYVPSYLDVLKGAGAYNLADQYPIPAFSYQAMDQPALMALRKGFHLDSIAGAGNEVSKILNLLHWVHNLIPHDGNHENPVVRNAMSMIAVCKKDSRGLNCRGLATVLNECYLALGIKSRLVTCMPKDSLDDDCHVINMVYSNDLQKWLWIDPTHDAYVMNEQGTLLSMEEVRERIINGQPLILNPDANWNHKVSTVKENYLYDYMAKNLYRMECAINSEYDAETWTPGRKITYVELLPLDAYRPTPRKELTSKAGVTFTNYKTNNPALFWARPN